MYSSNAFLCFFVQGKVIEHHDHIGISQVFLIHGRGVRSGFKLQLTASVKPGKKGYGTFCECDVISVLAQVIEGKDPEWL